MPFLFSFHSYIKKVMELFTEDFFIVISAMTFTSLLMLQWEGDMIANIKRVFAAAIS